MTKSIIYYTDNQLDPEIAQRVQRQIRKAGLPIVCSSLLTTETFGDINISYPDLQRGNLTMFKQILGALEQSPGEIVFFCEHDVLYHPSHFSFTPPRNDIYYYNRNVWEVNFATGHCMHDRYCKVSQLCCYRDLAIAHYRKRVARVEKEGRYNNHIGFEPGSRSSRSGGIEDIGYGVWQASWPNIDIRHDHTWSRTDWNKKQLFDRKGRSRVSREFREADEIPKWGRFSDIWNTL